MIIKYVAEFLFYGLMLLFGLFSFAMIYALLRFGKSLALGLIVSAFYLIVMFSLLTTANINFSQIPFPQF